MSWNPYQVSSNGGYPEPQYGYGGPHDYTANTMDWQLQQPSMFDPNAPQGTQFWFDPSQLPGGQVPVGLPSFPAQPYPGAGAPPPGLPFSQPFPGAGGVPGVIPPAPGGVGPNPFLPIGQETQMLIQTRIFSEDIWERNRGAQVEAGFSFEPSTKWRDVVVKGTIYSNGRDWLMIKGVKNGTLPDGKPGRDDGVWMFYNINFDWMRFIQDPETF